jgi:pimeloyl-ACP methyl ester carboxylesterase
MRAMADLPLVLLHAFPLDARMWNPVRGPLSSRVRLITPDQRGLGRTGLPETDREPSLEDAALDVLAMLDKLELDRVVLGGCSMGGYLSMAVLRKAPDRIGGLVLIDTKASADAPAAAANRRAVAERAEAQGVSGWLATSMLGNLLSVGTIYKRPDIAATVRDIVDSQPPSGVAWAQRAMAGRPDSLDLLRETEVPALVVVGAEDRLTTPDAAKEMADALPDSRLVVLPGAGHLSPLEKPRDVAAAILEWYP